MRSGIPSLEEYSRETGTDTFRRMERFSDRFLEANRLSFVRYRMRWCADPLRSWSRRWEYPYVFRRLLEHAPGGGRPFQALDAGSGITFFPYWIASEIVGAQVIACDRDRSLSRAFRRTNRTMPDSVRFVAANLVRLPFDEGLFQAIWCVSVLEHTDDVDKIVGELQRVLAPGGILIVTFDISVDGRGNIPPERGERIVETLRARFPKAAASGHLPGLREELRREGVLTMGHFRENAPDLLPWEHPLVSRLKYRLQGGKRGESGPRNDTFYCCACIK